MSGHELRHRRIDTNGISLHTAEIGEGVPVIFCHGFPGLWYSWHRQLGPVADAGWRAVAIDQRGCGRSDRPHHPSQYGQDHTTADLLGLIDALGADQAVLVGHDFGAPVVWNAAVRAPERILGCVALSVPYDPRRPAEPPTRTWAEMAEAHFYHRHYFQTYGVADRELNGDPVGFLSRVLWGLSGDNRYLDVWDHPSEGRGYLDVLPEAPPLPWDWLSEEDFGVFVAEHASAGFTGGLNWYRGVDHTWATSARWADRPVTVPSLYIAGEHDCVIQMRGDGALERMAANVPDLRGIHLIPGEGHTVQLEASEAVNRVLLDFLATL